MAAGLRGVRHDQIMVGSKTRNIRDGEFGDDETSMYVGSSAGCLDLDIFGLVLCSLTWISLGSRTIFDALYPGRVRLSICATVGRESSESDPGSDGRHGGFDSSST